MLLISVCAGVMENTLPYAYLSKPYIYAVFKSVCAGVIETTRPDSKNAQYHSVLKQGDALLNRIQRLSRVAAV